MQEIYGTLQQTVSRHDLLGVAGEANTAIFRVDIKLLRAWAEVLDKFSKSFGRYRPTVVCALLDKQGMHRCNGLECQTVGLENAWTRQLLEIGS